MLLKKIQNSWRKYWSINPGLFHPKKPQMTFFFSAYLIKGGPRLFPLLISCKVLVPPSFTPPPLSFLPFQSLDTEHDPEAWWGSKNIPMSQKNKQISELELGTTSTSLVISTWCLASDGCLRVQDVASSHGPGPSLSHTGQSPNALVTQIRAGNVCPSLQAWVCSSNHCPSF